MSARSGLQSHAFANNPLRSKSPEQSFQTLTSFFQSQTLDVSSVSIIKILPFKNGKPLSKSATLSSNLAPSWHLAWMDAVKFREFGMGSFVYLGSNGSSENNGCDHWAVDVSDANIEFGEDDACFVELRTLMVATNWGDAASMKDLAIAGHARAILEWHKVTRFCGHCGSTTTSIDAGRRKQCTDESCKKRVYPRVDPVVIMLVIDKENDCCLLSRQSRFVPRMWSCLAGFIEPGESLEEAVRRETWEEAGIEVGDVIYHSSQPWPVGPNSMPCQLMVGFFAFAKSFTISIDKTELQDAKWYSREEVKKALTYAEYEKAQKTSAFKVNQMCKGVERSQSISSDFNIESGELAPMFVPGPYAIAHHLISSWVNESPMKQLETNMSNL